MDTYSMKLDDIQQIISSFPSISLIFLTNCEKNVAENRGEKIIQRQETQIYPFSQTVAVAMVNVSNVH